MADPERQLTRLTEEQTRKAGRLVLGRVTQLVAAVERLPYSPEPGSSLYGDNRASDPHKVSHSAIRSLNVAIDHLAALRALLVDARVVHLSAPFTLIRAAIETSSAAVWVLDPKARPERVRRTLKLSVRDAMDMHTVTDETGLATNRSLAERRERINSIAAGVGAGPVKSPTSTEIVRYADEASKSMMSPLVAWRVCSGFAHGRLWTTLSVLDRDEFPGPNPDEVTLKVTSALDRVLWAAWAAVDICELATSHYRRSATSPYS